MFLRPVCKFMYVFVSVLQLFCPHPIANAQSIALIHCMYIYVEGWLHAELITSGLFNLKINCSKNRIECSVISPEGVYKCSMRHHVCVRQ